MKGVIADLTTGEITTVEDGLPYPPIPPLTPEELEALANQARLEELRQIFADCHSSHVIPLPGLTEFVLLICEYLTRSHPS